MQQPPSGGTWVGNTCDISKSVCALEFDESTQKFSRVPFVQVLTNNLNVKWGYTASRDDNNIGSLADLYSSWFSSALDIDE
ncbi:hypothetical protein V1477_001648 [Vespula maculifrons]|uniref:Uncharacterized protein n=1 Tax=Vespula maculifrons TaxID=7453 RepID=A0ABD2CYK0_VESMC